MMKRLIKWTLVALALVLLVGFPAFLYFIPPFFISSPETFSAPMSTAPPRTDDIKDPGQRAIAERGRYIVMSTGCLGCHGTPTPQGPDLDRYLAGGAKFIESSGTYVSRNLTPDKETGLARRTDDEVKRILRSGLFPDGHIVPHTAMPWGNYSNWSEEDQHAVVMYLRHLKPVRHQIPEPLLKPTSVLDGAIEESYAGKDYGMK
jgi:hypothetical protein